MAGAWYVHTIDFQQKGKNVVDVVNLSGAPGEREMCAKSSGVSSPGNWAGKSVGVTDIGSGTDNLTLYLGSRYHLSSKQFSRVAVGAGPTLVAYRDLHARLARIDEAAQHEVDALYGLLRGPAPLPKGPSGPTMARIRDILRTTADGLSATEIAGQIGISRSTAQRYLAELARQGTIELRLHYGTAGRPEHRYRIGATTN
jgi:hypothetical protein